jgi:hypothetical protein
MRRKTFSGCLLAAISGSLALGCGGLGQRNNYPNDPLLMSKKPVLGRAQDARPVLLASAEPTPPSGPALALAAAPRTAGNSTGNFAAPPVADSANSPSANAPGSAQTNSISTFQPAGRPGNASAVPVFPAVRTKDTPGVPAVTAVERQVSGNYGHATDYSWLQGVVDKHYQGHLYLRYCDHSVEDTWGGKVCLPDDPRLAQLKDGDVIQVEGEIVPDHDQTSRGAWHHYPHYQIRDLKVIQPKN